MPCFPPLQHSPILGHRASSHTVLSFKLRSCSLISLNFDPENNGIIINNEHYMTPSQKLTKSSSRTSFVAHSKLLDIGLLHQIPQTNTSIAVNIGLFGGIFLYCNYVIHSPYCWSNKASFECSVKSSRKFLPVGIVVFSHGGSLNRSDSPFSRLSLPSYSSQFLGRSSDTKSANPGPSFNLSRITSNLLVCLHL